MLKIDLNSDLGEGFGAYSAGSDAEMLPVVTSANIACGFHASDPVIMDRTVAAAAACGTGIGAHPGYPDLLGFGRRNLSASPAEIRAYVLYQLGALSAFCTAHGTKLSHVKPHGALYNTAAKDDLVSEAVCGAVADFDRDLILVCQGGSRTAVCAEKAGLRVAREVFADRRYERDGSLTPRSRPGSVLADPDACVRQVLRIVREKKVFASDGTEIPLEADTVCVHGDSPGALETARRIRAALEGEGIAVVPLGKIV